MIRNGDDVDATLIAFWYSFRWLIEEYHKCLKTGCKVKERQLETADRLLRFATDAR